jgi:hypothetical protein
LVEDVGAGPDRRRAEQRPGEERGGDVVADVLQGEEVVGAGPDPQGATFPGDRPRRVDHVRRPHGTTLMGVHRLSDAAPAGAETG